MSNNEFIISNIEELFCVFDNDYHNFEFMFDQVVGQVVKNQQHLSSFIAHVNINLSNASTRNKGIILLQSLLKFCPTDVLLEHAIAWINNSLKHRENDKHVAPRSFKIINTLLEFCCTTPELNKPIISNILEKIIDEIKSIPKDSLNVVIGLECLLTCLQTFAGSCGPRKIPLNEYLISYLDLPPTSQGIRLAGKCMVSLQQVGGGGVDGINYYNNWKKQQQRLIATIHTLMDQFFEYVTEFGDYSEDIIDVTPLEICNSIESKDYEKIAHKIVTTIIFLEEMLLNLYPVRKAIMPAIILNVITRGLTVTNDSLGVHVLEDRIKLSAYLCLIHKNLLQLLQCLFVSLGTNLILYSQTISKLLVNNLKNIATDEVYLVKTFCDLKLTTYETLRLWLSIAKSNASVCTTMDTLYPIIMADITPPKIELNLTIQNGGSKNVSKKTKKKFMEQKSSNFGNKKQNNFMRYLMNNSNFQIDICTSALQTVQAVLNYECSFIKVNNHKELQEIVIRTIYSIQQGNASFPYNNEDCQIELYKTLSRLTTNHHFKISPPLNYFVMLLTNGQSNTIQKISQICSEALSDLNAFIHPNCATLQLPLDFDDLKFELKDKIKEKRIEIIDIEDIPSETNSVTEENINTDSKHNNGDVHNVQNENIFTNDNSILNNPNLEVSSDKDEDNIVISDDSESQEMMEDKENTNLNSLVDVTIENGVKDDVIMVTDDVEEKSDDDVDTNNKNTSLDDSDGTIDLELKVDEESDKMSDVEEICRSFVDIVNE